MLIRTKSMQNVSRITTNINLLIWNYFLSVWLKLTILLCTVCFNSSTWSHAANPRTSTLAAGARENHV